MQRLYETKEHGARYEIRSRRGKLILRFSSVTYKLRGGFRIWILWVQLLNFFSIEFVKVFGSYLLSIPTLDNFYI